METKAKRPFSRLKSVSAKCDKYAVENDRRPFVFGMTLSDGSTFKIEGSVLKEDTVELSKIAERLQQLGEKDPSAA